MTVRQPLVVYANAGGADHPGKVSSDEYVANIVQCGHGGHKALERN
jgi:hypothetical protein